MRQITRLITALGFLCAAWFATAQEQPTPAPAPTPAPTAPVNPAPTPSPRTPTAPAEVRDIEIIEVRDTQDAPAPANAPTERRREVRIVDGDKTIWVDEGGEVHALGDVMDRALEFNPEIRAIRAEIQALMARLEQLEMKTAADVVRKRAEIQHLQSRRAADQKLVEKEFKTPQELAELDAEIAALELEMKYLTGAAPAVAPRGDRTRVIRFSNDASPPAAAPFVVGLGQPRPEISAIANEKLKAALSQPVSLVFEKTSLQKIVTFIDGIYEMNFNVDVSVREMPIDIDLSDVSIRDALTALTDANPDLAFIVRDYGVFATTRDRAISIPGPSIPEGVPYSPRASAMPKPAPTPVSGGWRGEPVFKDGEHVFERRKPSGDAPKPEAPPAPRER